MKKKDFFDSISEWKMENMSIDSLQADELKELIHKNVESLSEKNARMILEHMMYQVVTGLFYPNDIDEIKKKV